MSCDVSRLRYRGGSVLVPALPICPASRFPHLVISCCLLGLPMPYPLCRLIACVPSSSRAVSPAPLLAWLVAIPRRHLIRHLWQSACLPPCVPFLAPAFRLAPRPVLPWVMSSPSCPIALRAVLGLRSSIAPPCLSVRLGAGRDGSSLSPSPARLAAAACPGWRLACVRFLVAACPACSGAAVCVGNVMAKLYI